jgi:hypothetical protein
VWDPGEQEQYREQYEAEIAAAKDRPGVLEVGGRVRSNSELSPATVDRLTRTGIARLAEIEKAKKAGESSAGDRESAQVPA